MLHLTECCCLVISIVSLKGHKESSNTAFLNDLYVEKGSSAP